MLSEAKGMACLNIYSNVLLLIILLSMATLLSANPRDDQQWYLMARHGECMEINSLVRKLPDIGGVDTPDAVIAFMQSKGYKFIVGKPKELKGEVVFVNSPEKGLDLIFVMQSICKKIIKN